MGTKALRHIQLGAETVEGTAVAATTIWHGPGTMEDLSEVVFVNEDVGYVSKSDAAYSPKKGARFTFEETGCTFEQLPYLLAASVESVVTGAADGAGTSKIYQYDFNTTSVQAIKTYTLEGGDDAESEEAEGAFVESFVINGRGGDTWMMSANWLGRQVTTSTKTGALSIPVVEYAIFGKTKLYLDAIGGTIGTTQLTGTFLGFELRVTTGHAFKYSGDGNLYPTIRYFNGDSYSVELDITFEHDATGVARKVDWRALTPRLLRIQCEGAAVGTPGTTYTYKTIRIDCAAKVEKVDPIGNQEGNDILVVKYRSRYNPTAAKHMQIIVVNELVSLP